MTLQERIDALSEQKKCELAIEFLEIGLPIWEEYASAPGTKLTYYVEMMGLYGVDEKTVARTIDASKRFISASSDQECSEAKKDIQGLLEEYFYHNFGIRHWELELPPHPELIFFSAYNLLCHLNREPDSKPKEPDIYISINQSVDALTSTQKLDWDSARKILDKYSPEE